MKGHAAVDFSQLPPRELALAFIRWDVRNRFDHSVDAIVKELRRGSPSVGGPGYAVDISGLRCTVYRAQRRDDLRPMNWTTRELVTELKAEARLVTARVEHASSR